MSDSLIQAIGNLKRSKVFVLGDLLLDEYIWGKVSRISPEAPIQILNVERREYRSGGAANVARNMAALGGDVLCAGAVGRDTAGDALIRLLREAGIDSSGIVRDPLKPTPVKTRMIAHGQQILRVDQERTDPIAPSLIRSLSRSIVTAAARCALALVSDYNKGCVPRSVAVRLTREFGRRKIPVLVALKSRDYRKYAGVTGAMLNRAELSHITGEDNLTSAAAKLIHELRIKFLVVTLGENGMTVIDNEGHSTAARSMAREVYDVTGAGDTALTAFALGYASGFDLPTCAGIANAAAGIVVGKLGAETVTRDELLHRLLRDRPTAHRKILPAAEILEAVRRDRRQGNRVVFTNGCFDVLHEGHIKLLEFAKSKGDRLLVALNTDRSVRALKGIGRPIIDENQRSHVIAALECVDYVILFDERTPYKLIQRIRPDVLVKGEDYRNKKVVGEDLLKKYGGRVELAPLIKGISTSKIVGRILERTGS